MSVSVIECLEGALINIRNVKALGVRNPILTIAEEQLKNGIAALESGLDPSDEMPEMDAE